MTDVLKVILAIVLIILAFKILKGILGLLVGIAAVGLLVYGGMKLIEGPKR